MAGRYMKLILYVLALNILLNIFALFMKLAIQDLAKSQDKNRSSTFSASNEISTTTEPYIIPKLHLGKVSENKGEHPQFKRLLWSDSFLPNKGKNVFEKLFEFPKNAVGGVEIVLGVPTIAREGADYLEGTLRSLLENLEGSKNATIFVFIGEEDRTIVKRISRNVELKFAAEISSGLVQITSPPTNFYPKWQEQLRESFGDSFQRNKWRSKQNLDQIYMMMYAYQLRPKYYIMLEDDVVASKGYLTKIQQDMAGRQDENFVFVSYCQLGAIGKLFRTKLLPSIATFIALFWADKPLDWLLWDYTRSRVCDFSEDIKVCNKKVNEIQIAYKPSLFQHVGTKSSFPGKKQLLKDKSFKP